MLKITITFEGDEHQTSSLLIEGVRSIMQAIADFKAAVDANFAKIAAGIQALDDKITAFQNSPGSLSAADQAALDEIVAASGALAAAAVNPVNPVVPPIAPPPPVAA
jgi:hypothetical protein